MKNLALFHRSTGQVSLSRPTLLKGAPAQAKKEYNHYIEISPGSCFELETQLLIAQNSNTETKNQFQKR
jgi:four helix bundle protein